MTTTPAGDGRAWPPRGLRCLVAMERPAPVLGPIGFILPTFPQDSPDPWSGGSGFADGGIAALERVCRDAEALGADALWACDHLFWPGPCLECLTVVAVAAGASERARVGSCVLQLPLRDARAVAKQASTLQILSGGRMILGVGVGSHPGEYEQTGIDYHTRGRRLDVGIGELRRSWSTGPDETYRMLPAAPPTPVWIGGSSEAALRRAASLGDGWMPLFLDPTEYAVALERLTKEVERAGRRAGSVTRAMVLFVSIDEDAGRASSRGAAWMSSMYGIPARAFERHLVAGTASDVAETLSAYRLAGAEHVAVYVTADQPLGQFEQLVGALHSARVPARA